MILWLDIETTGLIPKDGRILEIAAVLTDSLGEVLKRFHQVMPLKEIPSCVSWVRKTHEKSGLWDDCLSGGSGGGFRAFMGSLGSGYMIGGNSVHFDIEWLDEKFGADWRVGAHHRRVDLSALKALGLYPNVGGYTHRAMDDVNHCIEVFKYVRAR